MAQLTSWRGDADWLSETRSQIQTEVNHKLTMSIELLCTSPPLKHGSPYFIHFSCYILIPSSRETFLPLRGSLHTAPQEPAPARLNPLAHTLQRFWLDLGEDFKSSQSCSPCQCNMKPSQRLTAKHRHLSQEPREAHLSLEVARHIPCPSPQTAVSCQEQCLFQKVVTGEPKQHSS